MASDSHWQRGKTPPRGRDRCLAAVLERGHITALLLLHFWDVYHLLLDSAPVKEARFLATHTRGSHAFIISLTELAVFFPLGSFGCDMNADLIMKQQERSISSRRSRRKTELGIP